MQFQIVKYLRIKFAGKMLKVYAYDWQAGTPLTTDVARQVQLFCTTASNNMDYLSLGFGFV